MEGGFSWLVLIAAFAVVTVFCGMLAVRLLRIGSGSRGRAGNAGRAGEAE
jgi:hypothetical protein